MTFIKACSRSKPLRQLYSGFHFSSLSSSSALVSSLKVQPERMNPCHGTILYKGSCQNFFSKITNISNCSPWRKHGTIFSSKNSFEKQFSPSFRSSFFDKNECGVHTLVSHPVAIDSETNTTENHIEATDQKYAVIDIKSKQYKITLDDLIISDKIHDLDIGESYTCNNVMLLGSQNETMIGQPYIENASVTLTCEEQTKDKKVIIFKKRRRKNSQRKNGFRREVTILRVTDIQSTH